MRARPARYATTLITAIALFAILTTLASAGRLSTSSQTFRATWSNIEFTNSFGIGPIACSLTLEGSFHSRTIAKIANALIGAITRADLTHPCTGGEAIARTETLPWHLQWSGFAGTLPNITSIVIIISRLRFRAVGSGCDGEYGNGTDQIRHTSSREAGGAITTITPSTDRTTLIRTNAGFCPERGGFRNGTTSVTALNSAARITITLI